MVQKKSQAANQSSHSVRHYEELSGASGRGVQFRPERLTAETLFRGAQPIVTISGCEARLVDASFSGLAFLAPKKRLLPLSLNSVHTLRLQALGVTLFEAPCRVVREEASRFGSKIAVTFEGAVFQPQQVQQAYERALLEQALANMPVAANIPDTYRLLSDEVLLLLRHYQRHLNAFEQAPHSDADKAAALLAAETSLLRQWHMLVPKANALIDQYAVQPDMAMALKRYTQAMLTSEFMGSPVWARGYHKPLGYPGDYLVMAYIYADGALGDSLFDKLMHRMGMFMGQFVRNRMHFAADLLAHTAKLRTDKPFRVTNVGCGMALELEMLARQGAFPNASVLTLVDQDTAALNAAYSAIGAAMSAHPLQSLQINPINTTFLKLFETDTLFAGLPPQDVVYSLGIMDYLSPKRAREFTAALYRHVVPGGTLLIANVREWPRKLEWAITYIMDWDLVYRNEAEMREMAEDCVGAVVRLTTDSTGDVYLMTLEKPL